MSTDTQVSPDAETQNNASEVESPEVTAPEAEVADGSNAEPEAKAEEKSPELVKLERELRKAQRINARLHQQATAPKQEAPAEKTQVADDPVSMAREIARIVRFTEKSNELVTKGSAKHADFMKALGELSAEVGPYVLPNGAPSKFMEVVQEVSDDPVALLYHLSKNDDIAEGLADLSPIQLTKKLSRIEAAMTTASTPQTNKAPKALEPVKATSSDSSLGSHLSTAEWMKRREAELRAKRG
tara:strand:+ start:49 stop:774 length:726 start_codon:yes stop_codon:yes gene_type:complete